MKNIRYITLPVCFILISGAVFSQKESASPNYSPSSLTVTGTDSICPGQNSTLTAILSGGGTYVWSPGGATTSSITVSPPTTQTYTVYATQGATHDTGEVTVTVVPLPKPVISGASLKCKGSRDTLTVAGGKTYLWSNGNTTTTYVTGPIQADSTITVTAYNVLGCSHDTTFKIAVDTSCPLGINKIQYDSRFHIFPNPNNGIFTLKSSVENGKSSIEIYNVLGEKIYFQFSTFNSPLSIDISNQPSGIYFYRIIKEDGSLAGEGKFMIR